MVLREKKVQVRRGRIRHRNIRVGLKAREGNQFQLFSGLRTVGGDIKVELAFYSHGRRGGMKILGQDAQGEHEQENNEERRSLEGSPAHNLYAIEFDFICTVPRSCNFMNPRSNRRIWIAVTWPLSTALPAVVAALSCHQWTHLS